MFVSRRGEPRSLLTKWVELTLWFRKGLLVGRGGFNGTLERRFMKPVGATAGFSPRYAKARALMWNEFSRRARTTTVMFVTFCAEWSREALMNTLDETRRGELRCTRPTYVPRVIPRESETSWTLRRWNVSCFTTKESSPENMKF